MDSYQPARVLEPQRTGEDLTGLIKRKSVTAVQRHILDAELAYTDPMPLGRVGVRYMSERLFICANGLSPIGAGLGHAGNSQTLHEGTLRQVSAMRRVTR